MTINTNNDPTKTAEVWIEAYSMGNHPDLRSFENFSGNFLKEVNNPSIKAENLISTLCAYPFSGIAISSLVKIKHKGDQGDGEEVIPVLTVIHHPFKDSPSPTFRKSDSLFGIFIDESNPKKEIQAIEFEDPRETFKDWKKGAKSATSAATEDQDQSAKTTSNNSGNIDDDEKGPDIHGIMTPSFLDFFDENFINGNPNNELYQPLNHATQIPAAILDNSTGKNDQSKPKEDFILNRYTILERSLP
jgi:hypothetical protein